jgi:chaperone required for assembly of F1-ATPase
MADWAMKRFWDRAEAVEVDGGYTVHLDGRPIRTPGKALLVVPSMAMAGAMAAEWDAQDGAVKPETMPVTKSANSAVDKVTPQFADVADMLADYAGTDLLCYRDDRNAELTKRQAEAWDPLLNWCAERFEAPLVPVSGVMFAAQPEQSLARLRGYVHSLTAFEMTGFHDLVTLPGSFVLGLAAMERYAPASDLWELSRLDERFQQEQWGKDDEAEEGAEIKKAAFEHALNFVRLVHK